MGKVLAVDVGGSNVKALVEGERERRRVKSGRKLTAAEMVEAVRGLVDGWTWDRVSVGVPAPVFDGRVVSDPVNLGKGWVGFDFADAFGVPTKVVNDAAMQALGSYEGGRMLFLGLGTGLGSALVVNGWVQPMELGHVKFRKRTYEDYVGAAGLERRGKKRWREDVAEVIDAFSELFDPEYIVLGGGNAKFLDELPPKVRLGNNANAFVGGFRMWDPKAPARVVG
jgi:polyphosphate glucokinase